MPIPFLTVAIQGPRAGIQPVNAPVTRKIMPIPREKVNISAMPVTTLPCTPMNTNRLATIGPEQGPATSAPITPNIAAPA
jgi:hypothetical protein